MPDTQISEALGLIDGGLQLLLAAVHADDPKREMLVRVGDLLRDVRSLQAALSGHVVGWRTMDSAPKDGTPFLAWESEDRGPFKCWWYFDFPHDEAYWTDYADSEPAPKYWTDLPAPPVQEMGSNPTAGAS